MTPGRRRSVGTLLAVGGCLLVLGVANIRIGHGKATEYGVEAGTTAEHGSDTAQRAAENARGKQAFYLGVQQAGWWLAVAGLGAIALGLALALLDARAGRSPPPDARMSAGQPGETR